MHHSLSHSWSDASSLCESIGNLLGSMFRGEENQIITELPNTSSRRSLLLKASLVTLTSPFLARNLTAIKTSADTCRTNFLWSRHVYTCGCLLTFERVCDWVSESEPFSIFNLTTSLFKTSPGVIFAQSSDFSWLVLGGFLLCVTPFKPWHIGLILHVTWQVLSKLVALLFFYFWYLRVLSHNPTSGKNYATGHRPQGGAVGANGWWVSEVPGVCAWLF